MGIVRIYKKQIKSKLDNRGIHCMFMGYSKDHKEDVYCMLNLSTLKIKNTRDVIWLNKSYGEWKGIKGHLLNKFELAEASSSDVDSDKSSKPKTRKTAKSGNTSSENSSNNKDEESDNSSNIPDQTGAKLQQAEDNLVGGDETHVHHQDRGVDNE